MALQASASSYLIRPPNTGRTRRIADPRGTSLRRVRGSLVPTIPACTSPRDTAERHKRIGSVLVLLTREVLIREPEDLGTLTHEVVIDFINLVEHFIPFHGA